ncbi:curli major subunit CsgA [Leclercia sp.]|uniref:curli major subunit CsgA n=1 Tax=Leclercia sp. TaxID=1898428 RepID=UPI002FDDDADA
MKLLKVAVIAAIVVSGSAMAGSIPQWGNNHGGNGNNNVSPETLTVYQYGGRNNVDALQSDARGSEITVTQSGFGNDADLSQGADSSSIDLNQRGQGNSATISQWSGKDLTANVRQSGGRNDVDLRQTSNGATANITQVGFGNTVTAGQY